MSEVYRCTANYVPRCYRRVGNFPSAPDRGQQEEQRQQELQRQKALKQQAEEAERKRKANEADHRGLEALNRRERRAAVNYFLAALEFDPQNLESAPT